MNFSALEKSSQRLSKAEYKARVPELRTRLLEMQEALKQAEFPVIILVSGVDGAGKGETVNLLNEWMDPRYLETFAFGPKTDDERERPEFWRFWNSLPAKGRIGLYVGSWYSDPIALRLKGFTSRKAWLHQMEQIRNFEQTLIDDGALVIKFWLHLSKKQQIRRMEKLAADPVTAWRVTEQDREHLRIYDRFRQMASETLEATEQKRAPWRVLSGAEKRYRSLTVAEEILEQVSARLAQSSTPPEVTLPKLPRRVRLKALDMNLRLERPDYKVQLEQQQGRLNRLAREAWHRGISSVILLEGWDAGGKGGIIRRLISPLDARYYRVIPVAAPTAEEHRYHYLWRFWRHIPRAGMTTVFDRSWYGRVMVERIEGFAQPPEWRRAYAEINEFERHLTEHGIVVMKYWLHITPEEQLARFRAREQTPHKQFKITEEDYRNRQRWPDYERAVEEMVARTDTDYAPWVLIEGNDKPYARVKGLRTYCDRLEAAIDEAVISV